LVLLIVCAGAMLASLDLFIVNVALPQMSRDLGAHNLSGLSWVLNGYTIIYASLLVLFGRLAEQRHRERGFLLGVAVFTVASAAVALLLCELLANTEPAGYERAALRWLERFIEERLPPLTEVALAAAALAELARATKRRSRGSEAAASARLGNSSR
jgi:MFS family permease